MSTNHISTADQGPAGGGLAGLLGIVVTRILVPLWLLTGAVLKLADISPSHLPASLIAWLGPLGVDLGFVVRFTIAVELVVVMVIWLLPSLARPIALVMLGVFLPVLVGDLMLGASSCGCFGSVQVNPWLTLVMDVGFFAGVLLLGRRAPQLAWRQRLSAWRVTLAGTCVVAAFAIGFGTPAARPAGPGGGGSQAAAAAATAGQPSATALPAAGYYAPDLDSWVGQRWQDLDVAAWIRGVPDGLDEGLHYVLFYRKDCEHCHELMEVFFTGELAVPTTAVAVPERGGFPVTELSFPCEQCGKAELPDGIDWFFQTPVLVRLNAGVVECAAATSAANPVCLAL